MSTKTTDSSRPLSTQELDAAFSEIAALSPDQDGIPSVDDGTADNVVPVPVPPPRPAPIPTNTNELAAGNDASPEEPTAQPEPDATGRPPSGTPAVSRKTDADHDAPQEETPEPRHRPSPRRRTAASEPQPAAAVETVPAPQDVSPTQAASASLLYRLLDKALDLIDRPFARLSPKTRHIIGLVGLVTLVISLVAGYVLPVLMPRDNAFTFLENKRAGLLVAPAYTPTEKADPGSAAP